LQSPTAARRASAWRVGVKRFAAAIVSFLVASRQLGHCHARRVLVDSQLLPHLDETFFTHRVAQQTEVPDASDVGLKGAAHRFRGTLYSKQGRSPEAVD
jgi:hypothetical protein